MNMVYKYKMGLWTKCANIRWDYEQDVRVEHGLRVEDRLWTWCANIRWDYEHVFEYKIRLWTCCANIRWDYEHGFRIKDLIMNMVYKYKMRL